MNDRKLATDVITKKKLVVSRSLIPSHFCTPLNDRDVTNEIDARVAKPNYEELSIVDSNF